MHHNQRGVMKKSQVIPAAFLVSTALALSLAACGTTKTVATPGPTVTGTAAAAPGPAAAAYTNANQVVQALKAHHVTVTNVVADSESGGAISAVWATTSPGDTAAIFGGSDDPIQDTEIVVFQDHADAVAYGNVFTNPVGFEPDPSHKTIVGTNWAIDAATSTASSIQTALGGTLVSHLVASAPAATAAPPVVATSAAATVPSTPAFTPTPTAASVSTPAMTTAQQQAVDSAQSYLALGSGFSEAGLLKQLTSSYGAGFTAADAQFAVNYLNPDWDAQAVLSAKGYLALGGFSASSLLNQLTSSYGAGFTQAQAEYAVSKVGL